MAEASTEIKNSLLFFGEDVLSTKFPSYVDGFKDITRRVVWCSRDKKEATSFIKGMGDIAESHVGGDSSVYGAIIRLGQKFMVDHPLITIYGKSGSYFAPGDSGAPRYLKMSLSEFARDLFFNNVHPKTLPMQPTKDFSGVEPKYFIPRLPTALILGNLTVGFGFKSTVPLIDFADVCDLVMNYAEWYEKGNIGNPPIGKMARYLVPSFPIKNLLKNKDELIAAYKQGDFTHEVNLEGWAEVSGNIITLRAVPYGTDFGTVTQKLRETMQDRKHWLWNLIIAANQYSSSEAEFAMEVKRGQNPFMVLDKLRSVLCFQKKWKPIHSYMKDGRALTLDPPTLTYLWYQERAMSIAGGLKYKQTDLITKKMALEAMLHISDHTKEVIKTIQSAGTTDESKIVDLLYNKFKVLTWKQAQILSQQKLTILANASKNKIQSELQQTESELETTLSKFNRIHETIYQEAQFLKKKYSRPRITKLSNDFIGHVQFGKLGLTNFFTIEELCELLNTKSWMANAQKKIVFYNSRETDRYVIRNGKLYPLLEMSKDIACEGLVSLPFYKLPYNVIIYPDKTVGVTEKIVTDRTADVTICPITQQYYAIHRNGKITHEEIDPSAARKLNGRGFKSDVIYALPADSEDMVVIHANDHESNTIRIDRILVNKKPGELRPIITGNMSILGVFPLRTPDIWLTLSKEHTKNNALEWLRIRNLENLMTEDHLIVSISKTQSNPMNAYLKRHPDVKALFTLEVTKKEDE